MQPFVRIRLELAECVALGLGIGRPMKIGIDLGEFEVERWRFLEGRPKGNQKLKSFRCLLLVAVSASERKSNLRV